MAAEAAEGYYAALGLTFLASEEQLKRAYRVASLKHHPDRNAASAAATDRFQLINAAYACLSDPAARAEYDGVFHSRCVLDQGVLTASRLAVRPLDVVYLFPVTMRKVSTRVAPAHNTTQHPFASGTSRSPRLAPCVPPPPPLHMASHPR